MRVFQFAFTVLYVFLSMYNVKAQTAGSIDESFGYKGLVVTSFLNYNASSSAFAVQPDDKIIQVGEFLVGSYYNVGFARFTKDGLLDITFGIGGQLAIPFTNDKVQIRAIHVLSDGKILAAGKSEDKPLLIRLNENGTLDKGFGSNGIMSFAPESSGIVDLKIHPNKKMIGCARNYTTGQYCVFRLNEDGSFDTTFGIMGKSYFSLGNQMSLSRLIIHTDGRIILTGTAYYADTKYDMVLIRLLSNGTVDPSFGTGGVARADLGNVQSNESGLDIVIQKDGKILSCGTTQNGGISYFLVYRFLIDGEIDKSFGTNGVVTLNYFNIKAEAKSMIVQEDGKILLAGYAIQGSKRVVAIARIHANGTSDSTFGNSGLVSTTIDQYSTAEDIHLQSDHKILIGGYEQSGGQYKFLLVRYLHEKNVSVEEHSPKMDILQVWPNPVTGTGRIRLFYKTNTQQDIFIRLISIDGRVLFIDKINYNDSIEGFQDILLPNESAGSFYFLLWYTKSQSGVFKLIIE